MKNINQLSARISARIAAGEVIEKPESILREVLDNSLDAGADEIVIEIENGGIDSIKVRDNGRGISEEDLHIIATRHATSKIRTEDDLYKIKTLGFRGEALYSIASVTKLTITSFDRERDEGHRIVIDNGERGDVEKAAISKGTIVQAENLFMDIPARRNFLKRPSTEAQSCRNLVISRALSNPSVSFKFYSDGALKLNFDKAESLKERVMMLYRPMGIADADVMHLRGNDEEYSIDIIATTSARYRSDRKEIRIYVNDRPVEEFSLTQAVTYGYGEMLPGGSFPYACVFICDNPELVDFNIHPAKKEVKLRNIKEIHHAIVLLLKNGIERIIPEIKSEDTTPFLFSDDTESRKEREPRVFNHISDATRTAEKKSGYNFISRPSDDSWIEKAKAIRAEREEKKIRAAEEERAAALNDSDDVVAFRYIGQAFGLFLIAEVGDELYFVDQHAAHERILYDELLKRETVQPLLVPIELEMEDDVSLFLDKNHGIYSRLGIILEKKDDRWLITSLPAIARDIEKEVAAFISLNTGDEKELESSIFAILACKAAIKAGDKLDRFSAEAILEKVFRMEEPACPHGRTFIIKLREKELREMVGRTK